jgi:drug/metabolite transporter (DMT)-like permease
VATGGLLLLLLATLSFSFGTLLQRRAPPREPPAGRFTGLAIQMASAGAITGALALPTGLQHAPATPAAVVALAFLTLVCSLLAFACYGRVVQDWPAARVGSWSVLAPLVAVALGALLLREPLGARLVTGAFLILGGVALVQFSARAPQARVVENADHG